MASTSRGPAALSGICPICAGTAMMPRSAPPEVRVVCVNCAGTGAIA